MFNNIKPTATEPWRQLIEVLRYHEEETFRFFIESKDKSLSLSYEMPDMRVGEYEGHKTLGEIISISSASTEHSLSNLTLKKEDIISVRSTYTLEEITWRKDAFEIEYKNDIKITFDVLED
ncbi:hypothetical protein bcgnr5379_59810 [Bacillus cereus]|uniref:hypothetical protein n=1 Tax=Bacillus sp. p3-SID196 TaxID=2940062 RepID=UPI00223B141B|nr:hypothetical protein [Bacillus sp. p3-SID196]MCT1383963.1 hypothetical protein [Bacillus sp. p3-SID196]